MFFFTLLLGFVILFCIWDYFHKKRQRDLLRKSEITGGFVWPLVGNVFDVRDINLENMGTKMRAYLLQHDKIFYTWMFYQLNVMSSDIKDIEDLLSSQELITKNTLYDMLSLWLGDGLIMSTGKKWHARRKIITPAFNFKILEQFVNIFDQQSDVLVEKLKPMADGATMVDVFPLVRLTAFDIIGETAMGVKINAQTQSEDSYVTAVRNVTETIAKRLQRATWRFDWLFRLTAPDAYNAMMDDISLMKNFTKNVIQSRREVLTKEMQEHKDVKDADTEDQDIGLKDRRVLLDVLLQATVDGKPLSNEDIREEVETFMFAGHDSTASGTSFALYLISRHPAVQQQLFQEIIEVMGDDKTKPITMRQLEDLKYMDCVLKESLRLYPPVPIIGRYFPEDAEINNRIIPAKTHFHIALFAVLRDPDNYKQPDSFHPERFQSDHSDEEIETFAYTPFSAGPRNCIGQKYAKLEMKSTISKVLRHYELVALGPEVIPSFSLVMRSANGINVGLKPRVYN